MAMMDDAAFLVSHIRNSFITSDDTGMCEMIIDVDEGFEKGGNLSPSERRPFTWHSRSEKGDSTFSDSGLDSDTELAHSYDILPDMDLSGHRRRSNTAQRLEKLKREKHKQSKIKHIQWKEVEHPVDEIGEYFEKQDVVPVAKKNKEVKSCLAMQLDTFASSSSNVFMEYAKFDGKATAGIPTKKIGIFLTMATPEERPYPMTVVTLTSAKVQDLIGLICWQYTVEGRQPPLRETVETYSLHIAEDDGEVDTDFPALDRREPISKFGFAKLALVESDEPVEVATKSTVLTIFMHNKEFSQIPVEHEETSLKEIVDKVLERRKMNRRGLAYRLEKQDQPGVSVDLDSQVKSLETFEFCLVRENSVRADAPVGDHQPNISDPLNSHHYKAFMVSMHHKLSTSNKVHLGIDGEKIAIDPILKGKFSFKQKPVTHDTGNIAACSIAEEKSSGRAVFRLVYLSNNEYKHHTMEADLRTAQEIVQKVNNILELKASPLRKEYLELKEKRKLQKRHTMH